MSLAKAFLGKHGAGWVALLVVSLLPSIALATPVKIKVIKANGAFFPVTEPGPTISWAQKPNSELQPTGSRGPDAREFEINLPAGVWYFGASVPDGYDLSYRPSPADPYRSLPPGGAPITIQKVGTAELVFNYTPQSKPGFEPANSRLTCLKGGRDTVAASFSQEAFGTSAGMKVGISTAFGGAPVSLELFDAAAKTKRLAIVTGEGAGGSGWQSTFAIRDAAGRAKYFMGQASGGSLGQWGFQASLRDLNQTDWSPLYPDRMESSDAPYPERLSPCLNLGPRFLDGQAEFTVDIVSTPVGGKLVRATKKHSVRARQDLDYREWQAGQSIAFPKMAAVEGNLRVYLGGPTRSWASPALRPQSPDFIAKEDGHCDLGFAKNDDTFQTLRSECRISSVAYALFVWTVNNKDVGLAIANEGGRVFGGRLVMHKALNCREPDGENPYPRCGNIEWHSDLLSASGSGAETFKKGAVSEYRMHYFTGSLPELADLGFTFPQGPRPKADIAFNMQREGSASLAINGIDGPAAPLASRGLASLPPSGVAPLQVSAPGSLDDDLPEESPLASLLADTPGSVRGAERPTIPDITKVSTFTPPSLRAPAAALPSGVSGRTLGISDLKVAGVSFRAVFSHSNKCLSIEGPKAVQRDCARPDPALAMKITLTNPGRSELSAGNGRLLCLKSDNAFKLDGSELSGSPCAAPGHDASFFEVVSRSDGHFLIRSAASGKCVDVKNADVAEDAPLQEFECRDGKPSQAFTLVSYQ